MTLRTIVICGVIIGSIFVLLSNPKKVKELNREFNLFSVSVQSAYKNKDSNVQVKGAGKVIKIYNNNSALQTFTVRLNDSHIVTVYHDIVAGNAINQLNEGDEIKFCGEYRYTSLGGEVHYTWRDETKKHVHGWIKHNGIKYQ